MKGWRVAMAAIALTLTGCRAREAGLPAPYDTIAVPEAMLAAPETVARGARLFAANCAICHGVRGDGNGIRKEGLDPPPRDFTNPDWRKQTSPRHVFFVIKEGMHGTAMPSWKFLSDDDTWALVAYVRSISGKD